MKILASDFDGTIYFRHEKEPYHQEDVDAIVKYQREGNLFGLCTGRPLMGILPFKCPDFDYDFYICNSGAMIYDKDYHLLLENYMEYDVLERVTKQFHTGVEIMVIAVDGMSVFHPLEHSDFREKIDSIDQVKGKKLLGFALHFETSKEAEEAIDDFHLTYPEIDAYVNANAIDCVPKGCSKATGIRFIKEYFQCKEKDISAIGDNYNDIPMLTAVENSYTFQSSPDGVKEKVKYIVSSVAECIASQQ